jgi:hypothetical protein
MGGKIPAGLGERFRLLKGRDSGNIGRDSGYYPRLSTTYSHAITLCLAGKGVLTGSLFPFNVSTRRLREWRRGKRIGSR